LTRVLLDARKARDFGIGRYILGLVAALARAGEFDLAAIVRPGDEELLPSGVTLLVSGVSPYTAAELVAVRSVIGRARPALFHAPHYVVPVLPPSATVVTIHDLMHVRRREHATLPKRAYATTMLRRAVRLAARIVAVSEATRRELAAFDRRSDGKTSVIPNGVDGRFRPDIPAEERARIRRVHRLECPYLLFLGNDKPHKNIEGLLDAFTGIAGTGEGVRLVLAGGSTERAGLRQAQIAARGLSAHVLDLGIVPDEDVPALLAEARALVLPSLAEGFGLPVLEAQAVGTPVACSNRGGLSEAAGEAAVFFDPEDRPGIASALRRVLADEELRASLTSKGLARAHAFSWERVAGMTSAVYRDVLGS
jgi:glycosyltransferase involved in cell wall biosynthesis